MVRGFIYCSCLWKKIINISRGPTRSGGSLLMYRPASLGRLLFREPLCGFSRVRLNLVLTPFSDSNPGPLLQETIILPLDQRVEYSPSFLLSAFSLSLAFVVLILLCLLLQSLQFCLSFSVHFDLRNLDATVRSTRSTDAQIPFNPSQVSFSSCLDLELPVQGLSNSFSCLI